MLERIIDLDTRLFIYLNGLGSETFDSFWFFLTSQTHWTPFFLWVLYLVFKELGWKQTLVVILSIGLLVALTNETTDLFKNGFERLRPNNDPFLMHRIRVFKNPQSFSFISGHASNSVAVITFLYLLLRNRYRWIGVLYVWPLLFGYSRIYLGVHFPADILCGYIWGILLGYLGYKMYLLISSYWQNKI